MLECFPSLLTADEVKRIRAIAAASNFQDGQSSAGKFNRSVKSNRHLTPRTDASKQATEIVLAALRRDESFKDLIFPHRIVPVFLNLYEPGMEYGMHADDPVIQSGPHIIRTDFSMTVFLTDPESYGGGELEIQTPHGEKTVKLPAGDAVVYTTTMLHRVRPVTRGSRLAVITWGQSLIRLESDREIVRTLRSAMDLVAVRAPESEEMRLLLLAYSNLFKRLAEV
jgi:PKHD-type hydroxylase